MAAGWLLVGCWWAAGWLLALVWLWLALLWLGWLTWTSLAWEMWHGGRASLCCCLFLRQPARPAMALPAFAHSLRFCWCCCCCCSGGRETFVVAVDYCEQSTSFVADFLKAWKLRGECYMCVVRVRSFVHVAFCSACVWVGVGACIFCVHDAHRRQRPYRITTTIMLCVSLPPCPFRPVPPRPVPPAPSPPVYNDRHLCDYDNAISSFKSALAIAPGDSKAAHHLAQAQELNDQTYYAVRACPRW